MHHSIPGTHDTNHGEHCPIHHAASVKKENINVWKRVPKVKWDTVLYTRVKKNKREAI